jgi:cytoskeleton protein RodZ
LSDELDRGAEESVENSVVLQEINPVPDQPAEAVATVGQQLRAARESAGLSVQDVAQSLKYSPRQIELIEVDNYAALPGNTVVRGFVRSYARLLKVEADGLLQMLEQRLPKAESDVRPPDNMGVANQPGDGQKMPVLRAAAIVLALTAMLLVLWHFLGPAPAKPTAASVSGGTPAVAATSSTEPTVSPSAQVAGQEKAEGGSATEAAAEPMLWFVFEGRSWVEVVDGTKRMIHTGENPAGTELKLNGLPPFDIVVGNAAKVKLTYGNRPVDLAPHTRAEVARLKLE